MNDHGIAAEPGKLVGEVWQEEKEKIGGIYSSSDGRIDKKKLTICMRNTISRVCSALPVDAVVFPGIIMRPASLNGSVLYWDGATENIEVEQHVWDRTNFSGESLAISLEILIIDKNNRLLLRNVAGIEHPLKYVNTDTKVKWERRKDVLTDKAKTGHAIAVGLHPLIPFSGYPQNPSFSKE